MNKTPVAHIGIALAAIFIVFFMGLSVWYGGRAAWSDASVLRASWLVGQWREGKGPVYTEALWQQTHDALLAALKLTPQKPQLLDDLGFLNAARADALGAAAAGSPELALQQSLLTAAIGHYRAATVLRPSFPYTWAYLALAKHLKGDNDAELWRAYDMAMRYGSREAGAQPAIAQVGFAHWNGLEAQRKAGMVAMVANAPAKPRAVLLAIAKTYGVALPP